MLSLGLSLDIETETEKVLVSVLIVRLRKVKSRSRQRDWQSAYTGLVLETPTLVSLVPDPVDTNLYSYSKPLSLCKPNCKTTLQGQACASCIELNWTESIYKTYRS